MAHQTAAKAVSRSSTTASDLAGLINAAAAADAAAQSSPAASSAADDAHDSGCCEGCRNYPTLLGAARGCGLPSTTGFHSQQTSCTTEDGGSVSCCSCCSSYCCNHTLASEASRAQLDEQLPSMEDGELADCLRRVLWIDAAIASATTPSPPPPPPQPQGHAAITKATAAEDDCCVYANCNCHRLQQQRPSLSKTTEPMMPLQPLSEGNKRLPRRVSTTPKDICGGDHCGQPIGRQNCVKEAAGASGCKCCCIS